jgi:hypothetical protein
MTRTITARTGHGDVDLQQGGKEGHAVLEKVIGDLHDA